MPVRVGLLTEGHDHLVLLAYLAKLLNVAEADLQPDVIDGTGHGWQYVERTVDRALRRFYGTCAQLAVLAMDDDGDRDLLTADGDEDPHHPRHWLHPADIPAPACRRCRLHALADHTRPALNWIPGKPGDAWPIVIAVPVESIEAWLLTTQALIDPGRGSMFAEQERRSTLKQRLYGRPEARRADIEAVALPLVRGLTGDHVEVLRHHSRSFADFAAQVILQRDEILTAPECWS